MKKAKRKITRAIFTLAIVGILVGVALFILPNTQRQTTIRITENTPMQEVITRIDGDSSALKSATTLRWAAKLVYNKPVTPGKYVIEEGMSNLSLLIKLRRGGHYPVKFTFNNVRTKQQLIQKLSATEFLFEWSELAQLLENKEFLDKYGLTPETAIVAFRPDTYEFYYDITAEEFFQKIYSYYDNFWVGKRNREAKQIGLTPLEVMTLASIVEEENHRDFEKPRIAGLYINRLNRDMLLQADPTVKFAVGDFSLKRILNQHLTVQSPYNTYQHKGLPPGPIRIPATSSVDAVLNYEHHDYLYMCAKEDFSGAHNFAATYAEHQRNARKYHDALDMRR